MPLTFYIKTGREMAKLVGKLPDTQTANETKCVISRVRYTTSSALLNIFSLDLRPFFTMVPFLETTLKAAELLERAGLIDGLLIEDTSKSFVLLY